MLLRVTIMMTEMAVGSGAVRNQMPPIRNVIGSLMERVVVTGPITASEARLGLGLNVSNNTLIIGDTR